MKKICFTLFCISLLGLTSLHAQAVDPSHNYLGQELNTITTAVPFLQVAPDSRAAAMGDMGVATSADVNSQHHNPAKYVFNKNIFGISVSYSPWLRKLVNDINLLYLSTYYKVTDNDALAFSLRYFSLGDIQFTDNEGNSMGTQKPNEFAIDLTYSRKLIDELSIALTPRFIYSNLTAGQYVEGVETNAGLAGAADISLFYEQDFGFKKNNNMNSTLRAGLNISNIGNKMSYSSGTLRRDFLPTNLKLGVSYELAFNAHHSLMLGVEVNKLLVPTPPQYAVNDSTGRIEYDAAGKPIIAYGKNPDVSVAQGIFQSFADAPGGALEEFHEVNWSVGMEYNYRNLLFVRAGYFFEHPTKGNRQFITLGAGIHYSIFGLDISYLFTVDQHHPLENTLRFTLFFDFASFNKEKIRTQGREQMN
ncbi:MAG: type IX secretion system outer membrane channel protein PorV [Bacteroidales bacterium]|nr:type IX secretion system outer membrane channel protein PorV [Bacteroidales bacterium]